MNNGFGKVGLNLGNRAGGGNAAQLVQIVKLPQALSNNAQSLRLEGQVSQVNQNNGTARIQTPEGDVDVQVKKQNLEQGQRLTLEIPAGRPPKQARVAPQVIVRPPENAPSPPRTQGENITIRTPQSAQQPTPEATTLTPKIIQKISHKIAGTPPPPISDKRTEGLQNNIQNQNVTRGSTGQNTAQQLQNVPQEVAKQLAAQALKNLPDIAQALKPNDVVRILSAPPNLAQSIAAQTNQITTITPQSISTIGNSNTIVLQPPTTQTPIQNLLNAAPQTVTNNIFNPATSQNNALNIPPNLGQTVPQPTALTTPNATQIIQTNLPTQIPVTQTITTAQTLNTTQINAALQSIAPSAGNPVTAAAPAPPATTPQNINTALQPILFDPKTPNAVTVQNAPQLDVQIVKITPPAAQIVSPNITAQPQSQPTLNIPAATPFPSALIGNTSAASLNAQVTGFTAQGLPLITAKLPGASLPQSFIMQYRPNNLVLGSQLQIIPKSAPTLPPLAIQPQTANPLLQGFQWPALDELYNGLLQISPQAASSLTRSLPSASNPTQMGAAAMMFIAAVKTGDMNGFLGDKKIELLQRAGKENLLSRLTQGADAGARAAPEAASSAEWRAVPLPMFWEGEIQRVTLYTRHESQNQQDEHNDNKNGQTRFVFDLSLTRMGKVQLDGFLKDQRLDLVVRTENAFSQPMQQTMRQAYTGALDQTSLSGDLNFQGSTDNWVNVLENQEKFGANA